MAFDALEHERDYHQAVEDFLNSQNIKQGLPPIEPVMGFVDSPEFSGQLPVDEIEGDD